MKVKKKLKKNIKGTATKPRLSVYRSLNHIYVQFIDDLNSKTLFSISSLTDEVKKQLSNVKNKTDVGKIVGKVAAETALNKGITSGVFDRGSFRYHGRIKALADGLRESGFKI